MMKRIEVFSWQFSDRDDGALPFKIWDLRGKIAGLIYLQRWSGALPQNERKGRKWVFLDDGARSFKIWD